MKKQTTIAHIIVASFLLGTTSFAHNITLKNETKGTTCSYGAETPIEFEIVNKHGKLLKNEKLNHFTIEPGETKTIDSETLPGISRGKMLKVKFKHNHEALQLAIRKAGDNGQIGIDKIRTTITGNPNFIPNYNIIYGRNFKVKEIDFLYTTSFTQYFSS